LFLFNWMIIHNIYENNMPYIVLSRALFSLPFLSPPSTFET
jgi:hypothetical protein